MSPNYNVKVILALLYSQLTRLSAALKEPYIAIGQSGEAQTPGLMVPNHALYQLSYTRIWKGKGYWRRGNEQGKLKTPVPPM